MKRIIAGVLSCVMVFSLSMIQGQKVDGASQETIASLDYAYSGDADVEVENGVKTTDLNKTKYGTKKAGYVFTKGNARLFASVNGTKKRKLEWCSEKDVIEAAYKMGDKKTVQPVMAAGKKDATVQWTKGSMPYFEVQLSTKGYKNVTFSAYVGATKKGPKDYALSYAVGSSNSFTKLSDSSAKIGLADNKRMTQIKGTLPAAANDNSMVKIRIEVTSMNIVDTTASGVYLYTNPTKGEAAINHILIQGTKVAAANTNTSGGKNTNASSSTTGKVTKVSLNKSTLKLKKGKNYTLKATVKATTAAAKTAGKKKLSWSSSNKKVATVNKKGKVVAKKKGTAKITVKYSKKIKATCKVTVK